MSRPHDSAYTHVTGQSEYIDDRPALPNEVFLTIIYSTEPHARIKKIDFSQTEKHPSFVAAFTAEDIHHNQWGTIFQDQPLLVKDLVQFVGESIAVVVSSNRFDLIELQKSVKVQYEPLEAILSIAEARRKKSFIAGTRQITRGDALGALKSAPHRLKGTIRIQGQDHFYLESQASIAYPLEDGQIEVHSSSQHPTETQHVVAHALGLPDKDVVCIVKRMGGGFGGKESQAAPFAAYAALAAHRLKRPARIILTKDDDMIMTGKRNPFENEYEVGFDDQGRILALDVRLFSDGGAYADLSTSIMERAMLHSDNAYFIPNVRIQGQVCKTHHHPHTAFRGFGGPKGVATIEKIIEEIAFALKKDSLDIRKINCYADGRDITPYGQKIDNNVIPELFEKLEKKCDYRKRRREIENQKDSTQLRGLSMTAVKFGIAFTTRFLNQGNAMVIIHRDGTLQASTGATEMGQGVNVRIAQLIAEQFGIDPAAIRMMPTRTDKNANTSPTAASSGTDLNGAAAVLACKKIKSRLERLALQVMELPVEKWAQKTAGLGTQTEVEIRDELTPALPNEPLPDLGLEWKEGFIFLRNQPSKRLSFVDLVNEAFYNRISLSDYAHYRVPNLGFNKLTGQGQAFLYYTNGVAASEVSVDALTGEVKVLRTDILMDLGRPINEGLDIGQVSGAFIQGMGWVTTENLYYSKKGLLLSHSPSTYKIPSIQDTPRTFNINLLPNNGNTVNVRGTKAVGEPPLLLGLSVWTAIHDAIKGLNPEFPQMPVPATQENILRAMMPEEFQRYT